MTSDLYDKLSLLCMAAAVSSALLFDKIEPYSWIAAIFGIVSACASISMYLFSREKEPGQRVNEPHTGNLRVKSSTGVFPKGFRYSSARVENAPVGIYGGASPEAASVAVEDLIAVLAQASSKSVLSQGTRELTALGEVKRSVSGTWMTVTIDEAGESVVRVHAKRRKWSLFPVPEEPRRTGTLWDPLGIGASAHSEYLAPKGRWYH